MCTKFEGPSWNGSVCIMFTSFVDRPIDRQTDRQTDGQTPTPYHNTSRQVGRIKIEQFLKTGDSVNHIPSILEHSFSLVKPQIKSPLQTQIDSAILA